MRPASPIFLQGTTGTAIGMMGPQESPNSDPKRPTAGASPNVGERPYTDIVSAARPPRHTVEAAFADVAFLAPAPTVVGI